MASRGSSLKRSRGSLTRFVARCAVALGLLGIAAPPAGAATLSVSPPGIVVNTNLWVALDMTGLATGTVVDLSLVADIDGNRQADDDDRPLMRYRVQDGVASPLGSRVAVCDTNGVPDGEIHARVSYFGLTDVALLWHAAGQYVWHAAYTDGSTVTSTVFSVTQPTTTVWIAGSVQAATSLEPLAGTPLAGALVATRYYSTMQGFSPSAWTDTNGSFWIYLPPGVATDNVHSVSAIAFGYGQT